MTCYRSVRVKKARCRDRSAHETRRGRNPADWCRSLRPRKTPWLNKVSLWRGQPRGLAKAKLLVSYVHRLVQALRDAFRNHGLCSGKIDCIDLVGENGPEAGESGPVRPMGRLPNARADERFSTMKEDLRRCYFENSSGGFTLHGKALAKLIVSQQPRRSVHTQRMRMTRHEKKQSDFWVGDKIMEAIHAIVAWPIRHEQGARTFNDDKTRWIAARRGVWPAVRFGGRYYDKRRATNESSRVLINVIQVLLLRKQRWLAEKARQFGSGFDLRHGVPR